MARAHVTRFAELSAEVLLVVADQLDADSLLCLEQTCHQLNALLRDVTAARCKRECFTTHLYPTIATYRMLAPVPKTWKHLYLSFSKLQNMRWSVCQKEGTSSSLRALKSDNQEYEVDVGARFLLRSGGHYWFSVFQTRLEEASLSITPTVSTETTSAGKSSDTGTSDAAKEASCTTSVGDDASLEFLRSPRTICMGKWEKIRATGKGPFPRRHHSMTCLPDAVCPATVLLDDTSSSHTAGDLEGNGKADVTIRRVLFFGGQSEGIPFDASNDLYLLGVQHDREHQLKSSGKIRAHWIPPSVTGQPPSRRSGHIATLLSPDLLLISGGSDGTTPIKTLEVHLLHIEGYAAFRWSTPLCSKVPSGRALHNVYRVSSDEVLIFGGRQIRESNGLLSAHRLRILCSPDDDDIDDHPQMKIEWSIPEITGDVPRPRRGHSTNVIGDNLLLFGGQDMVTSTLENDVRVLNVRNLHWKKVSLPGEVPCPRRGFKNQFFGTSLVISSGFVETPETGKMDKQLPDSDVHVLTIV